MLLIQQIDDHQLRVLRPHRDRAIDEPRETAHRDQSGERLRQDDAPAGDSLGDVRREGTPRECEPLLAAPG